MSSKMKNLIAKTLALVIVSGVAGLAASLIGINPAMAAAIAVVSILNS